MKGRAALDRDIAALEACGIQASAQRVAIAGYVLHTDDHPSADEVLARVREAFPTVSRATVYNTLHTFVARGLLRSHVLSEGRVVFDPRLEPHHHFIDDETGAIHDIPWRSLRVSDPKDLPGFEVREFQVVLRGRVAPRG